MKPAGPQSHHGFTILELLVSATLLSLIFLLTFGGLYFGARTWDRVDHQSLRQDRIVSLHRFLRARLGQKLLSQPDGADTGQPELSGLRIQGGPSELRFVSSWPPTGRMIAYTLRLKPSDDAQALFLSWHPVAKREDRPDDGDDGDAAGRIVLEEVRDFQLRYFGVREPGGSLGWRDHWPPMASLPGLIEIRVTFSDAGPSWPPFVVQTAR